MFRTVWKAGVVAVVLSAGCGGEVPGSFANSAYIEITSSNSLKPSTMGVQNGMRIVFVNHDASTHTVNWESPLTLSATADPGGRAWFELPPFIVGSVLHYHLDASGAAGSVTIVGPN